MKCVLVALFVCCFTIPVTATTQPQPTSIQSAVSVGFEDGLHNKYLRYVAERLNVPIAIHSLSFSRRLRALQLGELDILVGLQSAHQQSGEIIFIEPEYQTLASTFFIRADEPKALKNFDDLLNLNIAVTPKVTYFSEFDQSTLLTKVEVGSLQQKIKLLVNGRVDAFIHNKDSTMASLKVMGQADKVTLAHYQPKQKRRYFFAISAKSKLYPRLNELKQIVNQAVKSGKFAAIRQQHYAAIANAEYGHEAE